MINVVFVGDSPSPTNVSPEIPFVGAKCFRRLTQWINYIKPDYYTVVNSSSSEDIAKVISLHAYGFKVVCLGEKATSRMPTTVEFVKLPHPSGSNLQVNDIAELGKALGRVKEYCQESINDNIEGVPV